MSYYDDSDDEYGCYDDQDDYRYGSRPSYGVRRDVVNVRQPQLPLTPTQQAARITPELVDDERAAQSIISRIVNKPPCPDWLATDLRRQGCNGVVAVDVEGISLSRSGPIALFQLATPDAVFVFDVATLGDALFSRCGLRALLENKSILKVLFDPRMDADALYHQHNAYISPVCDLQPMAMYRFLSQQVLVGYVQELQEP